MGPHFPARPRGPWSTLPGRRAVAPGRRPAGHRHQLRAGLHVTCKHQAATWSDMQTRPPGASSARPASCGHQVGGHQVGGHQVGGHQVGGHRHQLRVAHQVTRTRTLHNPRPGHYITRPPGRYITATRCTSCAATRPARHGPGTRPCDTRPTDHGPPGRAQGPGTARRAAAWFRARSATWSATWSGAGTTYADTWSATWSATWSSSHQARPGVPETKNPGTGPGREGLKKAWRD